MADEGPPRPSRRQRPWLGRPRSDAPEQPREPTAIAPMNAVMAQVRIASPVTAAHGSVKPHKFGKNGTFR
jgi:hypothetical protein